MAHLERVALELGLEVRMESSAHSFQNNLRQEEPFKNE